MAIIQSIMICCLHTVYYIIGDDENGWFMSRGFLMMIGE